MYRKNEQHKQRALFSSVTDLPDKQRKRLETSWAVTFYEAFFCRMDEDIFAVLYRGVFNIADTRSHLVKILLY